MIHVENVRNVNQALVRLRSITIKDGAWRLVSPRGMETLEYCGTFITEYEKPLERVLFSAVRDANPFFHFMEALWILDGRNDVGFLSRFNSQMVQFSDDGKVFHAPYGFRLREHFDGVDQLLQLCMLLMNEPDTRRAVLCIWDPRADLNTKSRDIPCNDLIFFKLRGNVLDMTVCCRSNDAVLGAYGANAVQFSFLQEFIARAIHANVGVYRQISDSFHVYTADKAWNRVAIAKGDPWEFADYYSEATVEPYRLTGELGFDYAQDWLSQLREFTYGNLHLREYRDIDPFFNEVAIPIEKAWQAYKKIGESKNARIANANEALDNCHAIDWRIACKQWMLRRVEVASES